MKQKKTTVLCLNISILYLNNTSHEQKKQISREFHGLFLYHTVGGGARRKGYSVLSHRVILKPAVSVIVYSPAKLPKAISLVARQISLQSNITRRKANKTGQVSLRVLGLMRTGFLSFLYEKELCENRASFQYFHQITTAYM